MAPKQTEEEMIREIRTNALQRLRSLEQQTGHIPTHLPGYWAPAELWPGEDYGHINNAFTDYRLT